MAKNRLLHLGLAAIFMVALAALAALAQAQGPGPLEALGTAFTYQGSLIRDNKAYSGSCAMTFNLYDALSGGTLKAGPLSNPTVTISNSVFTVPIDFGAGAFTGERRWLAIDVKCGDDSASTPLPRQELTAAPYALSAASAGGLQGRAVSGGAPATGQALIWDSSAWSPGTVISAAHTHWGQTWTGTGTGLTLSGGSTGLSGAGTSTGVSGSSGNAYGGSGVFGSNSNGTLGYGVYGQGGAYGVVGVGTNWSGYFFAGPNGVHGSGTGTGVEGVGGPTGVSGSGTTYGIYGTTSGSATPRYAGYFDGDVHIQGNLSISGTVSKSGGSFKIDHPLDPANKYLSHSFVESPDMMDIYNGTVTLGADGTAWVELPTWFEALNRDFRYQLTPIGAPAPNLFIARKVQGNRFQVGGGGAGLEVSWQVTGVRHDAWADAHRIPVEEDKPAQARGTYLHPELFK